MLGGDSLWLLNVSALLLWTTFSRMILLQIALEDTNSFSLRGKGKICLRVQDNKHVFLGGRCWLGLLAYLLWGWLFLNSKLWVCSSVTQICSMCSHHPGCSILPLRLGVRVGAWGADGNEAYASRCAMSNKVLCFWPRSLMFSVSIHETVGG